MSLFAPTTLSSDEIALPAVLDAFYARVRGDVQLCPQCSAGADWPAHIAVLAELWAAMMLNGGRGPGIPLPRYPRQSPAIAAPMFERWLTLWREVAAEMLPPDRAAAMQVTARRISLDVQRALGLRICEA